MGKTIRVPDPVYERIESIADRKDCARGEVVRDWMEDSDMLDNYRRGGADGV